MPMKGGGLESWSITRYESIFRVPSELKRASVGVRKGVLELKKEAAVAEQIGHHTLRNGGRARRRPLYGTKPLGITLGKILYDVGQVVARAGESLIGTRVRHSSSAVGRDIAYVPTGYEITEGHDARMVGELAQSIDRKHIRRLEGRWHATVGLVGLLARNDLSLAHLVVQEAEGFPMLGSSPLKPFLR